MSAPRRHFHTWDANGRCLYCGAVRLDADQTGNYTPGLVRKELERITPFFRVAVGVRAGDWPRYQPL